jgi:hypothetical protein
MFGLLVARFKAVAQFHARPFIPAWRSSVGGADGLHQDRACYSAADAGVFKTPWTATMTYGRSTANWSEAVRAKNTAPVFARAAD